MAQALRVSASPPRPSFAAQHEDRRFAGESPPGRRRSAQKKAAAIENCETKKQARIALTKPQQGMKNKDREAMTEVTFCTIKSPLRSLLDLLGEPLPKGENPIDLAMRIGPLFAFLPMPVLFDIEGDDLLIRYPEEPKSARDRAAKLACRAAQRAEAGDYASAASLWRKALKHQPSLHSARRDLAHAYFESGDYQRAKPTLLQVLYCDPEDHWALCALANIWFRQAEYARAEPLWRLALAIEPANALTLSNLAAACCMLGRRDEGVRLFQELVRNDPGLPHPYLGLAYELARAHRCEEALSVVGDLFAKAKRRGRELDAILANARHVYMECHQELLDKNRLGIGRAVQELHTETERLTGSPIRIAFEDTANLPGVGVTELVWDHGRDHHLVRCLSSYPEPFRPHLVAKSLLQIQAHWEARNAGRRRVLNISPQQQLDVLEFLGVDTVGLVAQAMDPERVARKMGTAIRSLCQGVAASAADMRVEARLKRTIPVLRSAQFFSHSAMTALNLRNRQNPDLFGWMPPRLARIFAGLHGLTALFLDWLFDGVTDYAAHYSGLDGFDLSRKLWQRYQDRSSDLKPGAEFDLGDEFAEIVGLAGRYEWRRDPVGVAESFAA
jgi:tetratricopeptide (TPR) repeat protein